MSKRIFRRARLILLIIFLVSGLFPIPGKAADEDVAALNIATLESRPISSDRIIYYALKDISLHTSFSPQTLDAGYGMANRGETDGVVASTPDINTDYPNLVRVSVPLEKTFVCVFVREDTNLVIGGWEDLADIRVGITTQRSYLNAKIPDSSKIIERDNTSSLMEDLSLGSADAAILTIRSHETFVPPEGIVMAAVIDELTDYLYLNKKHEHLVPEAETALSNIFSDGRAEQILNDQRVIEPVSKKTVLHIYSTNMQITREESLNAVIRERYADDMSVEWYTVELNSRQFSRDPNRLVYYANLLRQDCVSRTVSAVIVSGDDALEFLKDYYYLYFRNVPVLFYGVNQEYEDAVRGFEPFFTGITDRISVYDTVAAALRMFPDTKNLYVVNDYTTEGSLYREAAMRQLAPLESSLNIRYSENTDCDTMLGVLSGLPEDTIVFVGSYFSDSNGQYYPMYEMTRLLQRNCALPIFALHSSKVEYNSVGGRCLNYTEVGNLLSDMLKSVLAGASAEDIAPVIDSTDNNKWVFDKIKLDRFGIPEGELPPGSVVINKVPTIWESDPRFAITLILLIIVAAVSATGISIFFSRYSKQKELLEKDSKLREVKNRLEHIINSAPLAFMISLDGKIVEANEYSTNNLGLKTGDNSADLYSDPAQRKTIIDKATHQSIVTNQILWFNMPDGGTHRFLANVTSTDFEEKRAFILWAIDIEDKERKSDQIKAVQQSLQTVMDMLPVPVRIVDSETGLIQYCNRAITELFMFESAQDVVGQPSSIFRCGDCQDSGIQEARLGDGKPVSAELVCVKNNGECFDALVTACLIGYNGRAASLDIIRDLTSEKAQKRMLLNAAEREKEANLLKSRFLVNMSHEIRTPMNAIIGLTEIELQKKLNVKEKEIYTKINISAKNLLEIINDILDLSKIEADKIELYDEEFELEEVLNSALLVASPRLDGKSVEFMLNAALDLPRFVVGDRTRLWQILKNFLDNSAKYTEKGKIVLTAFINRDESDDRRITLTFIIEDTGIGIGEEQMGRLFMPYEQIYNEAQKRYSGTGLGMAISKQLCELMGGRLEIESHVGMGTTIRVNIPFLRSQSSDNELMAANSRALSGLNVLAVDDDKLSLDIMYRLLRGGDAACTLAKSGDEALDILMKSRDKGECFDLILLDYMMEGLTGLETARRIHLTLSKAPKLLMVTAYQKLLLKSELERCGVDDVIEKPFIPSQFIRKLCSSLGLGTESDDNTSSFTRFKDVHVLICEDYKLNQEVAVGMLSQFGITAAIAENGKEGVEMLNENGDKFDLVFMDLQMPVMDGYEATRRIRADRRFDNTPIISLTADAMTEVVEKCLEIGMNDHIAKPIEFDRLQKVLRKWLPECKRDTSVQAPAPVRLDDGVLTRFGGKRALYEKALEEFARLLPDGWPGFKDAVGDLGELKREIHKLKGVAGNLSEDAIFQAAVEFEKSLRAGEPDSFLYDRFVKACGAAKKRITEQFGSSETLGTGTAEEFYGLLSDMREALESYNPKASADIADSLSSKEWPGCDTVGLRHMCALAGKYEFEDALDELDSIVKRNEATP